MGIPTKGMGVFLALAAAVALSGCGGGGTNSTTPQVGQASIYTVGTDAPLPSVVSCEVNVTGISLKTVEPRSACWPSRR